MSPIQVESLWGFRFKLEGGRAFAGCETAVFHVGPITGSVLFQTRRLRAAYFDAGIPEYWLIDANGPKIKFEILVHQPRGYRAA